MGYYYLSEGSPFIWNLSAQYADRIVSLDRALYPTIVLSKSKNVWITELKVNRWRVILSVPSISLMPLQSGPYCTLSSLIFLVLFDNMIPKKNKKKIAMISVPSQPKFYEVGSVDQAHYSWLNCYKSFCKYVLVSAGIFLFSLEFQLDWFFCVLFLFSSLTREWLYVYVNAENQSCGSWDILSHV